MDKQVITSVDQVTKDWLTKVLANNDALTRGKVESFVNQAAASDNSKITKLSVEYSLDAQGSLPTKLLLKICKGFGRSEVAYYTQDYKGLVDAPLPKCYDAAYSQEQQAYHVLLADLSDTHQNNWKITPNRANSHKVVEAIAKLHAHHWDKVSRDTLQIEKYLTHVETGLAPMLTQIEGKVEAKWLEQLQNLFQPLRKKLVERYDNPNGFTLIHGDLNAGNILSPLTNKDLPVYIIDRQPFEWSLTQWLAVGDLAYMIVHWWETEQRRELEFDILRHYHQALPKAITQNYSYDQLIQDYRLCAIQSILVAIEWCCDATERKTMEWLWMVQLQRAMTAFYDLGCDELLA